MGLFTFNAEDPKVIAAAIEQVHGAADELVNRATNGARAVAKDAITELHDAISAELGQVRTAITDAEDRGAARLEALIDRIDGATITTTIKLKPKKGA